MNAARLLEYFDRIAEAPDAVSRLRKFILDLAVRGKLVEQDPNDEPTSELVSQIKYETDCRKRGGKFKEPTTALSFDIGELPFSVPKTWSCVRFIELAEVGYGFAFDSNCFNSERRGMPLIRIRDISNKDTEAYYEGEYQDLYITCPGDILVGMDGDFNVRIWSGPLGLLNQRVMRARNWLCGLNRDYIAIPLQAILNYLHQGTSLTTVKHLSAKQVNGILIPLPPLAEQHRIVAKVDELMALCDRLEASQAKRESRRDRLASASLKRIGQPKDVSNGEEFRENVRFHLDHLPRLATRPEHVKELRQTILNLAVRGKLVPQDPNDEPASELLKKIQGEKVRLTKAGLIRKQNSLSVLSKTEIPFIGPFAWEWARLGDIGLTQTGTTPSSNNPEYFGDYIPFVKPADLTGNCINYRGDGLSREGISHSRLIQKNSVLMVCIGSSIGKVNLSTRDVCCNQQINAITPCFSELTPFVHLALSSDYFRNLVLANAGMGTLPILSKGKWEILPIPLPPLAEQHRIVAKVDELMDLCDQLEVQLTTSQRRRSRLLEATLCEALGVTCLPVARPTPSPVLSAPPRSEPTLDVQSPRLVDTPKAAVQGRLVEQPTPQVGKPRAANGDVPGAILAHMHPGQEYSRAQLAEALGLSVYEWNMAIRELKESGRVVQTGERRGARYRIN
ncbi:MAG: restriction endonuclease subunit S [Solidesulfovibrio sp.]|uniref:restriction endonuclease subunit S n=1 Tax=Solidesulfovibrio sp. TaxID=2910990 RepID=UPI0031597203